MVSLPSFGEWMSKRDILVQSQIGLTIQWIVPFFTILYGNMICRTFLGMPSDQAFMIPLLAGVSIFGLAMNWDFTNRNKSTGYLPLNMTLAWGPDNAPDIITTITDYVSLPSDVPDEYMCAVKFNLPLKDDRDEEFQHAIFISRYPMDKTFRKIPGQWVSYGGSVFVGMAAHIWATFRKEYRNLTTTKMQELNVGNFKMFTVDMCLEDSQKKQINSGLYSDKMEDFTVDQLKKAAQLDVDMKAHRLAAQLVESEKERKALADAYEDSNLRAKRIINRVIDDIDKIKKERSLITRLMHDKWVRVILIMILIAAVFYVARYYKVI